MHHLRPASQPSVRAAGIRIRRSKHLDVKKRAFPSYSEESLFVCGEHPDIDPRLDRKATISSRNDADADYLKLRNHAANFQILH
jgi:hypothetical protein